MTLTNNMNDSEKNIERIIKLMQTDQSVDAPEDAIKWSKNIFKTRTPVENAGVVKRIVANLVGEILPGQTAVGERSAGLSQSKQMLFEAGAVSVDLRLHKTEDSFEIRGQILGDEFEGVAVRLGNLETKTDGLGGFRFDGLRAGEHDLSLTFESGEVLINGIELS